jgi:hypothetical protein
LKRSGIFMFKRRILSTALASALVILSFAPQAMAANTKIPTSSSSSVSAVEPDGSTGGVLVNTIDGKSIMDYPASKELKQLQQKKSTMADLHSQYKKGQLSKETYVAKLKGLGASEDIINTASNAKTFNAAISNDSVQPLNLSAASLNVLIPFWQIPQDTTYFCGPATASELIKARTFNLVSQYTLQGPLHCNTSGTPWYDGAGATGYPMADTLNSYMNTGFYIPYGTTVTASSFQSKVIYDIDSNYGTAGDAWEVPGGPHLIGHPVGSTIYHWFAIFGYGDYGNSIYYKDSVAGSTVSWSGSVPASSAMDYVTLARIVNGRGIIW